MGYSAKVIVICSDLWRRRLWVSNSQGKIAASRNCLNELGSQDATAKGCSSGCSGWPNPTTTGSLLQLERGGKEIQFLTLQKTSAANPWWSKRRKKQQAGHLSPFPFSQFQPLRVGHPVNYPSRKAMVKHALGTFWYYHKKTVHVFSPMGYSAKVIVICYDLWRRRLWVSNGQGEMAASSNCSNQLGGQDAMATGCCSAMGALLQVERVRYLCAPRKICCKPLMKQKTWKKQVGHLSPCQFFLTPTTIIKKRFMYFHPWGTLPKSSWYVLICEEGGCGFQTVKAKWLLQGIVWMNWGAKMQRPKAALPAAPAGPIQLPLVPCCNWKGWKGDPISYASKNICCKPLMTHKKITPRPTNVEVAN